MASSEEKHKIIIEAQELASQKLAALKNQFEALGGAPMLKLQKESAATARAIAQLNGTADKGHSFFGRFAQGIAIGTIAANAAMAAFRGIKDALVGTIDAAADAQKEWAIVTASLERHGMATAENIRATHAFAESMQNLTGVADEEYGRAVMTMIDRGATLSQSFGLVRAAADLATSKNKDVTRTLNEMANMVGSGDFKQALEKYGITVDTNKTATAQLDEAIARLNLNFGGAATDAADSYSVRVAAMKQSFGDLQESIGAQVLPILTELAKTMQMLFNGINEAAFGAQFDAQGKMVIGSGGGMVEILKNMQSHISGWANIVVGACRLVGNAFQIVFSAAQTALSPVADTINAMISMIQGLAGAAGALSEGDFGLAWDLIKEGAIGAWESASMVFDNMATEAADTSTQIAELGEAWNQFAAGLVAVNRAVPEAVATASTDAANKAAIDTQNALALIPAAVDEVEGDISKTVEMATAGAFSMAEMAGARVRDASVKIRSMMGNAVDSMITNMVTGRQSMGEIFKGIAQDFMIFFIKEALGMIVNMFIPGLGSLLGGIFDTPANDRMAARQGRDFMMWFTRGMLAEAKGGSEMAVGLTRSSNRMVAGSLSGGGAGGGGPVIINVTVSGNVMSDHFIEKTIAPKLKKLVNDGRAALQVRDEQRTGGRDIKLD